MKTEYVVLGAKGYVGRRFVRILSNYEHVTAVSRDTIDYTDSVTFQEFLRFNSPRWENTNVFIINCAGKTGYPNVDQCEIKQDDTINLNVVLPAMLSDACHRWNHTFCHVSSGCIYTGTKTRVFTEKDTPNFCFGNKKYSFYSGSKALGEQHVSRNPKSYIWRIRMPFDERNVEKNYLSKLFKYDTLLDATNSLTHLTDFIETSYEMTKSKASYGIYNMVNPGHISTREIVEMMKDITGVEKDFKFFDTHSEFNATVKTPRSNCVLCSDKANTLPGVKPMRPVREAITDALTNWN